MDRVSPCLATACLFLGAASCMRAGFSAGEDAALVDASAYVPDAAGPNPWLGSFTLSTPKPLTALNTSQHEMEPAPTADGLTLHFARGAATSEYDVYRATRASRTAAFGGATPLSAINTDQHESRLFVTADGVTAYLSAARSSGVGGADIWLIRRAGGKPAAAFDPGTMVNLPLNSAANDWDPFVSADGLRLYYCVSTHAGGPGGNELLVAARSSTSALFSSPKLLSEINTARNEGNPSLTADGLVLVFNSTQPGGAGLTDIYYATRASVDEPFSSIRLVPVVNSTDREGEPFVSADGRELFFSSDRPGGAGQMDLYHARVIAQ
jgi:Tol biopolymer transport system component